MKFPDRLTVPGKLTVSLCHNGDGRDVFRIEIEDAQARVAFLALEIEPAELMLALSSRAYRPCELTLNGLDRLGMVFEHKTENLPEFPVSGFSADKDARRVALEAHVKPWEVDGWMASSRDLLNSHNGVPGGLCRVGFVRWVPAAAPLPPPPSFGAGNLIERIEALPAGGTKS